MQAVYGWDLSGTDASAQIASLLDDAPGASEELRAFSTLLAAGVAEHVQQVDAVIGAHLQHWEISRIAKVDLAILRVGAYELLYQPLTPGSVVIDEAVLIAKEYGSDASFKFVNGVLDAIRRENGQ